VGDKVSETGLQNWWKRETAVKPAKMSIHQWPDQSGRKGDMIKKWWVKRSGKGRRGDKTRGTNHARVKGGGRTTPLGFDNLHPP